MSKTVQPHPADNTPLLTGKPWLFVGLSRSAWYRLVSAGHAPAPVSLPGTRPRWRTADLARWVQTLRPSRRRARHVDAEAEPADTAPNHAAD
jgi:predicted DNA-binding transcriptional regulator AlpA